jgi:uncharacterized membrane protein
MIDLIFSFLLKNGINTIDKKDFELQIQTHPNHNSFRAISDTLDYFEVENIVANVPEDALNQLPTNFLTLVGELEEFVLVKRGKDSIFIKDVNGKTTKISVNEFLLKWKKTIIAVEEVKSNSISFFKNLTIAIPILLVLVFILSIQLSKIEYLFLALSFLGIYISILLVKEKMGYRTQLVQRVCAVTPKSNCNDIINSKGSVLFNKIDIADASFITFTVFVFSSLFTDSLFSYLLCIASLPILFYTIYYQAFVLKKWCVLCLMVAGVLLGLATISYFVLKVEFQSILFSNTIEFLAIVSLVIAIYYFVKSLILNNKELKNVMVSAIRVKRDPVVLKHLIASSNQMDDISVFKNEVTIGNKQATKTIISFTNPYCGHCKAAFENYLKAVKVSADLKIIFRFSLPDDFKNTYVKITVRLVEIFLKNGEISFIKSYTNWFEHKDEKKWFSKYGTPHFEPEAVSLLKQHIFWSQKNELNYTPATIIGTTFYPNQLDYKDLPFVLDFFYDSKTQEQKETTNVN